jgi:hypothetical protein
LGIAEEEALKKGMEAKSKEFVEKGAEVPVSPARARCGGREQGVAEEQALKAGMEQKAREFVEKGAELYAKA